MARFTRVRSLASAFTLAAMASLILAASAFAGSGVGPFPR